MKVFNRLREYVYLLPHSIFEFTKHGCAHVHICLATIPGLTFMPIILWNSSSQLLTISQTE